VFIGCGYVDGWVLSLMWILGDVLVMNDYGLMIFQLWLGLKC
jgi:hypothetical protein